MSKFTVAGIGNDFGFVYAIFTGQDNVLLMAPVDNQRRPTNDKMKLAIVKACKDKNIPLDDTLVCAVRDFHGRWDQAIAKGGPKGGCSFEWMPVEPLGTDSRQSTVILWAEHTSFAGQLWHPRNDESDFSGDDVDLFQGSIQDMLNHTINLLCGRTNLPQQYHCRAACTILKEKIVDAMNEARRKHLDTRIEEMVHV
jgi:hypothetical protein